MVLIILQRESFCIVAIGDPLHSDMGNSALGRLLLLVAFWQRRKHQIWRWLILYCRVPGFYNWHFGACICWSRACICYSRVRIWYYWDVHLVFWMCTFWQRDNIKFGADWFSIVRQLAFLGGAQICHRKTYIFGDGPKKWKSDVLTHIACGNLVALPIVCKD